jgi:hypothetical protein
MEPKDLSSLWSIIMTFILRKLRGGCGLAQDRTGNDYSSSINIGDSFD